MSGWLALMRRYCCIIGVWLLKPGSFKLPSSLPESLVTICTNGAKSSFLTAPRVQTRPFLSSLVRLFGIGGGIGLRSVRDENKSRNEKTAPNAHPSHYRRPARRGRVRRSGLPGIAGAPHECRTGVFLPLIGITMTQ